MSQVCTCTTGLVPGRNNNQCLPSKLLFLWCVLQKPSELYNKIHSWTRSTAHHINSLVQNISVLAARFEILAAVTTEVTAAPGMCAIYSSTDVSDEHLVSIVGLEEKREIHFYNENGSSWLLRNVGTFIQEYMVSHSRKHINTLQWLHKFIYVGKMSLCSFIVFREKWIHMPTKINIAE